MTDENQQSATADRRPGLRLLVPVLLLLGCALYLPNLGASDLWDPWEPKYAQTAREMAERGDWLIPHYRADERLNKPPMTYWLIAAGQAVAGVNETGARLPSALLAILGGTLLGAALAIRGRPLEGLIAGAALLSCPQWLLVGRFATPDLPLAFFLAVALVLALVVPALDEPRLRRVALIGIALAVAAAGLTDWPRGLLLPAWAVLAWGALRWSWKGPAALAVVAALYVAGQFGYSVPLNLASAAAAVVLAAVVLRFGGGLSVAAVVVGALLIVAIVTPWFVVAHQRAPDEMSILEYKHALNLGESVKQHKGSWDFVSRTVAVGGFPWTAVAVLGLLAALPPQREPRAAVLAAALLGGLLFFSLSEAKMGHFYGVMQPALAGLAGIGVVELARRPSWKSLAAVAMLGYVGAVVWRSPQRLLETATVKSNLYAVDLTYVIVGVALAWSLVLVAAVVMRRAEWAVAAVLPAALLAGVLGTRMVPALGPRKSLGPLLKVYQAERRPGEPLGFLAPAKESLFYYGNNSVPRFESKEEADEFLSGPGVKFLISDPVSIGAIAQDHPGKWDGLHVVRPKYRLFRFVPEADPGE